MDRHIMLLFLSDVKFDKDNYRITPYEYETAGMAETTNESAVRYLLKTGYKGRPIGIDKMFVFATKKVQKSIAPGHICNAQGKDYTHLSYFKDRIRDVIPQIDERIDVFDYDEDLPIMNALQMVVDMGKRIDAYLDTLPTDDTVYLHADCTGGMRHANMMMLDIIRLMQYHRIRIGKILYSNFNGKPKKRVEEANAIYNFFDLIAGTEEFVRFGSVDGILAYYQPMNTEQCSAALQHLIRAMKDFAQAIKLCQYSVLRDAVQTLRQALQAFIAQQQTTREGRLSEEALNDSIMAQLQRRIQRDYKELLDTEDLDDIVLIRWCLVHDYLQQALTLYTERIPEILCNADNGWIHLTENGRKGFNQQYVRDTLGRTPSFFLFSSYQEKGDNELQKQRKKFFDEAYSLVKQYLQEKIDLAAIKQRLAHMDLGECMLQKPEHMLHMLQKLRELQEHPQQLMNMDPNDMLLQQLVQTYYERFFKQNHRTLTDEQLKKEFEKSFSQLWGKKKLEKLINFLQSNLSKEAFFEIFTDLTVVFEHRLVWLCEHKYVETPLSNEELRSILKEYQKIKYERNHSNHARMDYTGFTADALKTEMLQSIHQLEYLKKKYKKE